MKVAILGGGPSGAFAAEKLASAGVETVVFDEKLAWEKPCGGGITFKAYSEYPFLFENDTPKKIVHDTVLAAPNSRPVTLALDHPLLIYSRYDLNRMLLDRAERAGAKIEKARVIAAERAGSQWTLRTRSGSITADYCIAATGARNPFRDLGAQFNRETSMTALGYFVPSNRDHIDVQFLPGFEGYIWVFPRSGHLSVGICGKGKPATELRAMLESYMRRNGIPIEGANYYGHMLPCLDTPSWKSTRVEGEGWMAVGDAAGLVDPITGEGIYYAIRSADLAARALLSNTVDLAGAAYRRLLRRDFMGDLEFASRLSHRVFHGSFLRGAITTRMVQFTRLSPKFREVMQDLFAGTQPYIGLKQRLLKNINWSIVEIVCNLGMSWVIPRRGQA
jgi:geranylgeranyl reductase family protein